MRKQMVMLIEVTPPHPMPGWLDGWLDDTLPPQGGEDIIQPSINPPRWGGVGGCPYQPHSPYHIMLDALAPQRPPHTAEGAAAPQPP